MIHYRTFLLLIIFLLVIAGKRVLADDQSAFEWESAVPIEELIEEDSGEVKFYVDHSNKPLDESERIPTGYIPKSAEKRIRALNVDTNTTKKTRAPASAAPSEIGVDRLKAIEKRLTEQKPSEGTRQPQTFWGQMKDSVGQTSDNVSSTVKDGLGQLYRGLFSAPADLAFGEDMREVALIQSGKGYIPKRLDLVKGVKTRIYVTGMMDRRIAFVSDPFNIQRAIKGNGITVIEFTPDAQGLHKFYDPINKMEGWFLVR